MKKTNWGLTLFVGIVSASAALLFAPKPCIEKELLEYIGETDGEVQGDKG